MARSVRRAMLLSTLLRASRVDGNEAMQRQIAELEGLVQRQERRIQALEAEAVQAAPATVVMVGRRIKDDAGEQSLYGDRSSTRWYSTEENLDGALDHLWLIICGALVMFMQAGFAVFEAGSCRFLNVQSIILKNLTDVCVSALAWWTLGWSFAYSGPYNVYGFKANSFAGYEQFFGRAFSPMRADGQVEPNAIPRDWFFRWTFCSVAATIASCGVAERVKFSGHVVFSFMMSAFVFPIVVAWTWDGGFLAALDPIGAFDFAGSGVVHLTGGAGALVGAALARPRTGRFDREGVLLSPKERLLTVPEDFRPYSWPLVVLGTFCLWFGWYGFNCGSTLAMHKVELGMQAAHVAMNTTIAAASAGLTVLGLRFLMFRKPDLGGLCNGILAGLVSITAGCSNMECGPACGTAVIGALLFQATSSLLRLLRIDDPLDAFAVHGACGAWGVFAAALFDWGSGFKHVHAAKGFRCHEDGSGACSEGLGGDLVGAAAVEICTIFGWSAVLCALVFGVLKVARLLQPPRGMQHDGFDLVKDQPRQFSKSEETVAMSCI